MTNQEKLSEITYHFGVRTEIIKLLEEAGEFIDLCYASYHTPESKEIRSDLTEEAADVMVVFSQLVNYFKLDKDEIQKIYDNKIDRTLERIENGWYSKHR